MNRRVNKALLELSLDEYIARNNGIFNASSAPAANHVEINFKAMRRRYEDEEENDDDDDIDGLKGTYNNLQVTTKPPEAVEETKFYRTVSNNSGFDLRSRIGNALKPAAAYINLKQLFTADNQPQQRFTTDNQAQQRFTTDNQAQQRNDGNPHSEMRGQSSQEWKTKQQNRSRDCDVSARRNINFPNVLNNTRHNNPWHGVAKSRPAATLSQTARHAFADSRNFSVQVLGNRGQPSGINHMCKVRPNAASIMRQRKELRDFVYREGGLQKSMVPMVCTKLLEILDNVQTLSESKYRKLSLDEGLQSKMFSPAGVMVGSTDGMGIDNFSFTPHTTNIKLSHRFAQMRYKLNL